jgi:hypothetical protein
MNWLAWDQTLWTLVFSTEPSTNSACNKPITPLALSANKNFAKT